MIEFGMGLALGVFCGNFFFHGLVNHDWSKGLYVGILASILTVVFWYGYFWLRQVLLCRGS